MCYRRLLAALLVGGAVAWGLWLSPLAWPRATLAGPPGASPHPTIFFSPDARQVVTVHGQVRLLVGSDDEFGTARIWDAKSGACIATLTDHARQVNSVTFSPDGTTIAVRQQDGKIRVWDRANGKLIREVWHEWLKEAQPDTQIVYTPDGRLLYQHAKAWTQMYDVETNVLAFDFAGHNRDVRDATTPMQGYRLATNHDHLVVVRLDTGEEIAKLERDTGAHSIAGGALSPDGRAFAIRLFISWAIEQPIGVSTHRGARRLARTSDWAHPALSNEGKWLTRHTTEHQKKWILFGVPTGVEIHRVRLYDTESGAEVGNIPHGHTSAFSPDNRTLAVTLENGDVQLWDLPLRKPWERITLGALASAGMTYLLLTWRARRRLRHQQATV